MTFHFEYPVFLLAGRVAADPQRRSAVTIGNPVTLHARDAPTALAMFTDRDGAEQFRDEHAPGNEVGEIVSESALMAVLRAVRSGMSVVALDPYRFGARVRVAAIDEILAEHGPPPDHT